MTNWLARVSEEDIISIEETERVEIFNHQEKDNKYLFFSRGISIYEAVKNLRSI